MAWSSSSNEGWLATLEKYLSTTVAPLEQGASYYWNHPSKAFPDAGTAASGFCRQYPHVVAAAVTGAALLMTGAYIAKKQGWRPWKRLKEGLGGILTWQFGTVVAAVEVDTVIGGCQLSASARLGARR